MFNNVGLQPNPAFSATIPFALFAVFQLKFAIITPALITGGVAERIRFSSLMVFIVFFSIFIYAPLAHWTWHPEGFLRKWGVLDFAGGTVVHISAGFAALSGAIFLKKRKDGGTDNPTNIPYSEFSSKIANNHELVEFSIEYAYSYKEFMSPSILNDFNAVIFDKNSCIRFFYLLKPGAFVFICGGV